jgi:hypothetical protein
MAVTKSGVEVARVQPTAAVSDWMLSVGEVLPIPHRASAPYTLGEAAAELGAYAQAVVPSNWNSRPARNTRESLSREIRYQSAILGGRVAELVNNAVADMHDDSDPDSVIAAVAAFAQTWHSETAISAAFHDLCDASQVPGATTADLRKLASIIASQIGPAAHDTFSVLSKAVDVLLDTEEQLARWHDGRLPRPLTEADRLQMATDVLVAPPRGRIVVWTVYYRAATSRMREAAGPMTFLRADWALPNAFDVELHDFPERAELRAIRTETGWLDKLHSESQKAENRLVLVRIDLGERQVAGAEQEARRRIEAVLSVAVHAGGTSWRSAGAAAVLIDGTVHQSSLGVTVRERPIVEDDDYGIAATADVLSSVTGQLGEALAKGPMPTDLVEALTSLREARMTDHRDVLFYGRSRVTARTATALEDHAMELVASVLRVRSEALAEAVQRRQALAEADRRIATQLMAPFDRAWAREHDAASEELERDTSKFSPEGVRLVSFEKVVKRRDEIRALAMTRLQRADFEHALSVCTDPHQERRFLEEMWRETGLLRSRHRRVRNAVNHGLPLDENTLNSVRDYADTTSSRGMNIALTWFKNGDLGEALLQRAEDAWLERMDRINHGLSWAGAGARSGDTGERAGDR